VKKSRLAVAYTLLVGVPLSALVAILRAGTHLAAPMALRGNWNVHADLTPWRSAPCKTLLAKPPQLLLNVAQSGNQLAITLNDPEKTFLTGTLSGIALTAAPSFERKDPEAVPGTDAGCASAQHLNLQAIVNQQGKLRFLTGTLQLAGCASCPPIIFTAAR